MPSIKPGTRASIAPKMVPKTQPHSAREDRSRNHFVLDAAKRVAILADDIHRKSKLGHTPIPIQWPLPFHHGASQNPGAQNFLLAARQQCRSSVSSLKQHGFRVAGKDCCSLPPNSFSQVLHSVFISWDAVWECCSLQNLPRVLFRKKKCTGLSEDFLTEETNPM